MVDQRPGDRWIDEQLADQLLGKVAVDGGRAARGPMTCRPREQGSAGAGAGRRDDRASGHEKVMTREHMRLRLIDAVVLRRDDVGMIPEGLGSDHLSICPPGLWVHSSGWAGARHLFVGGTPGM